MLSLQISNLHLTRVRTASFREFFAVCRHFKLAGLSALLLALFLFCLFEVDVGYNEEAGQRENAPEVVLPCEGGISFEDLVHDHADGDRHHHSESGGQGPHEHDALRPAVVQDGAQQRIDCQYLESFTVRPLEDLDARNIEDGEEREKQYHVEQANKAQEV